MRKICFVYETGHRTVGVYFRLYVGHGHEQLLSLVVEHSVFVHRPNDFRPEFRPFSFRALGAMAGGWMLVDRV